VVAYTKSVATTTARREATRWRCRWRRAVKHGASETRRLRVDSFSV
jgi:hypothetical protein